MILFSHVVAQLFDVYMYDFFFFNFVYEAVLQVMDIFFSNSVHGKNSAELHFLIKKNLFEKKMSPY